MTDEIAGDLEPDDAYDAADPLEHRVAVLTRIALAVGAEPSNERDVRRRVGAIELAGVLREAVYDLEDEVAQALERLGG